MWVLNGLVSFIKNVYRKTGKLFACFTVVIGGKKQEGLKVAVHPLFFAFAMYFACIGRIFVFLTFTFTALVHELGHRFASERLGYRLDKITLMPYGAIISGDVNDLKYKDEISVAVAGPLTNLAIAVFFTATWWLFPETYAFTELATFANFSLAVINFIPSYPLDGGRVLLATLSLFLKRKTALLISRVLGVMASAVVLIAFFITCAYKPNYTLAFFGVFMLMGATSFGDSGKYVRIYSRYSLKNIARGMEIKKIAVGKNITVKELVNKLDECFLYEVTIVSHEGVVIKQYGVDKVYKILTSKNIYERFYDG